MRSGTCYNMDEPLKNYAKWKKPETEDHVFYNYTYINCTE